MGKLMEAYGVRAPLRAFASDHAVFGTCAGLIMLASRTTEGDQPLLAVLDVTDDPRGNAIENARMLVEMLGPSATRLSE